ncbi:MAG: S-(hydroxymethyl)glutathione dehydrogenase / alcohol dehydrogenase [Actinomycetota bacterium]|jgi:S-(hydroxymethyl)glutathione dehydrogenase/alcohol dehydrogenase|nr:S-(hydroxymethyl)glutathione dehydrogenase / alcohol dehydrogenase [Actinomycetota bacterium]
MVRAAVLTESGAPLRVADIDLPEPGPGQVRVRIAATGVCHSDLSLARGVLRQPTPAVLGHESAGTVVSVGAGVTVAAPGDRVVLCWAPPCGACWFCGQSEPWLCERSSDAAATPYATYDGQDVYPGLSTAGFAEETVVSERAVIAVPDGVPLEQAALVGCAVMTGVGAVLNTAKVRAGQSVLVVGLGGVGLSVVQGARLAAAGTIIAVDRSPEKLALAQSMGATEVLEAGDDLAKQVRALTERRGVDHAFDCVGLAETIRTSWSATRRGGSTTIVGIGGKEQQVTFTALELFHFARTLQGCVYGSTDPMSDIPKILQYAAEGRLDLGALISGTVGLDGIDGAFADMEKGVGARAVVVPA